MLLVACRGERVGNELLGGQVGSIVVAARQARSRHAKLARFAADDRLQVVVEDMDLHATQGLADRDDVAVERGRPDDAAGGIGGHLGRSVEVDQRGVGRELGDAPGEVARQQLAGRRHVAQPVEPDAGMARALDQGGEQRRHDDEARDLPFGQQRQQGHGVASRRIVGNDARNALQQAAEGLPDGIDEVQCRLAAAQLVGGEGECVPHPFEAAQDRAMRPQHALGQPRRARRVDHIGQGILCHRGVARAGCQNGQARRCRLRQDLVDAEDGRARLPEKGELVEKRPRRQDHRRGRVLEHEAQTKLRVGGIEGNPRAAGLEDAEHARRRFDAAAEGKPDHRSGRQGGIRRGVAGGAHRCGNEFGAAVQFGKGRLPRAGDQGERFRCSPCGLFEERVNQGGFAHGLSPSRLGCRLRSGVRTDAIAALATRLAIARTKGAT